jgi:hypothetical protein
LETYFASIYHQARRGPPTGVDIQPIIGPS